MHCHWGNPNLYTRQSQKGDASQLEAVSYTPLTVLLLRLWNSLSLCGPCFPLGQSKWTQNGPFIGLCLRVIRIRQPDCSAYKTDSLTKAQLSNSKSMAKCKAVVCNGDIILQSSTKPLKVQYCSKQREGAWPQLNHKMENLRLSTRPISPAMKIPEWCTKSLIFFFRLRHLQCITTVDASFTLHQKCSVSSALAKHDTL